MPIALTPKTGLVKDAFNLLVAFKSFMQNENGKFLVHRGNPSDYYSYSSDFKYRNLFLDTEDRTLNLWFFADPECKCRVYILYKNMRFKRLREFFGLKWYHYPEITIKMDGYEMYADNDSIRKVLECRTKYMTEIMDMAKTEDDIKRKRAEEGFQQLVDNDFQTPVQNTEQVPETEPGAEEKPQGGERG